MSWIVRKICRHSGTVAAPADPIVRVQRTRQSKPIAKKPIGGDSGSNRILGPRSELVPDSSITPSLVASRVTGVAPLYVHFDATATTSTETSYPFHECNFKWNFGDTAAGNYSTTGLSRNIAYGGVAGHVFEAAGAFTVTLTIKDPGGATSTATTSIAVTAADSYSGWLTTGTICISQGTDFTGAPTGAETHTTSSWATAMGYVASGKRVLLRKGESWSASAATITQVRGDAMIGSFGTGTDPVITASSDLTVITLNACDDIRICDINIVGSSTGYGSGITLGVGGFSTYHGNTNILCSRVHVSYFHTPVSLIHADIGGVYTSQRYICHFESHYHHGLLYITWSPVSYGAFLGTLLETADVGHIIRIPQAYKVVISNCILRWANVAGTAGRHLLKLHSDSAVAIAGITKYVVVSDSEFEADAVTAWAVAFGPENSACNETVQDVIFERNLVKCHQSPVLFENTAYFTARNNVLRDVLGGYADNFIGVTVNIRSATSPSPDRGWIYNNTIYGSRSDANQFIGVGLYQGTNMVVRNNYGSGNSYGSRTILYDAVSSVNSNNQLSATPGFVSAGTNFHLAAGSAAIDTGIVVASVYDDKDLITRSATYEQGAYEYRP